MVDFSSSHALQWAALKVTLDTNILLSSLKRTSSNRPIFDAIRYGKVSLAVSSEILLEYLEIISQRTTPEIGHNVVQLILSLPRTERIEVKFRFNLIKADADDNKFVDCAIAANSELIVTNDKHFNELSKIDFPKVGVASAEEFLILLKENP